MLFKGQEIDRKWGLACSISSAVLAIVYMLSNFIEWLPGQTVNASGTGAYLFLLASLALIGGIVKYTPVVLVKEVAEEVGAGND
jgi:hypothetical protein